MCKKIVCVMLMACVVSIGFGAAQNASATTSDWTSGQSWSYKWEMSFAEVMERMEQNMSSAMYSGMYEDMSMDFWASGGMVQMLTVTYNGNNHFSYTGGTYADGKFGYSMSGSFENMSMSSTMKMNLRLDSDFSGSFDVVEANYTDYWSGETYYYYGITNQAVSSTGNMDMSVTMDMNSEGMAASGGMSIVATWTLDLSITYDPALPWMPKTLPIDVSKTVTADYTGSINGHVKTTSSGVVAETMENIDESVFESLSGSETFYYVNLESGSSTINKPSPVLGAGNVGSSIMMGKTESYSYDTPSILNSVETESAGEFNDDDTSYSSLTMGSESTTSDTSMFGGMPSQSTTSATATAEEVSSFLSNKEGYFNSCDFPTVGHEPGAGEEEDNWLWMIIGIIGVVAAVVIVSVALIAMRRRKKAPPMAYAPQYPQQPYTPQPYQPQQPYPQYPPQQTQQAYQPQFPPQQVPGQQPVQVKAPSPTPLPQPPTKPTMVKCPNCGAIIQVTSTIRPLEVVCPKCGAKGMLR